MDQVQGKYEALLEEKHILSERIAVCEQCVEMILDFIATKADTIHVLTAEDIVLAVHTINTDLQTELLHVKFELGILAGKM